MAACRAEADLVLAAAASPTFNGQSSQLSYSLGVGNLGRSATTDVVIAVTVPSGTQLFSGSGDGWTCQTKSDTEIDCTRATLAIDENSLLTLSITPPPSAPNLVLSATVSSSVFDPITVNNTAMVGESLVTPQYSGGGVGCSMAAPNTQNSASATSLSLLLGLCGLLVLRRRRWV